MRFSLCFAAVILLVASCQPYRPMGKGGTKQITGFSFQASSNVDQDCLARANSTACLFFKSPVGQSLQTFAVTPPSASTLENLQTYSVNFNVSSNNGELTNPTLTVNNVGGPRAMAVGQKVFAKASDPEDRLGQLMSYYWMSHAAYSTFQSTGTFWALNKDIQVFINDEFTGYNPRRNSIHLRKPKDGQFLTHDAGVLVQLLGLANVYHASGDRLLRIDDTSHKSCGEFTRKANHCCTDSNGCTQALIVGAADYFNATIFPQDPTLGESWVNRLNGIQACGLSRSLEENKNLTLQSAFNACQSSGDTGYIYNLGTVYASIWWEVRKKSNAKEIDQLYQYHLQQLDPEDNFLTAFEKIALTDETLFNGKYRQAFRTEFLRRGVSLP